MTSNEPNSFINAPNECVTDSITGFLYLNPHLSTLPPPYNHIVYDPSSSTRIPVISGGGSGHEPSHLGWVGNGMLAGCVCGGTFASPSVSEITSCIRAIHKDGETDGFVMVVKNYTGDRVNFTAAREICRREMGVDAEIVFVADDSAVPLGKGKTGRRGVAGTVFVHKACGAVGGRGGTLGEVADAGRTAANRIVSMGVSLTGCEVPGTEGGRDGLEGKVMFGMGIHGETGSETKGMMGCREIMGRVVGDLCGFGWDVEGRGEEEHMKEIVDGDEVVVLVNNLGGTSVFEMGIVVKDTLEAFEKRGVKVVRIYQGSYMTSFDMKGVSVTALVLNGEKEKIMGWLDAETECQEWKKGTDLISGVGRAQVGELKSEEETKKPEVKPEVNEWGKESQTMIEGFVSLLVSKITSLESTLTAYDKIVGDGDCGITMKRGADAIASGVKDGTIETKKGIGRFVGDAADVIGKTMGGTSGGLLHIMMLSMSTSIVNHTGTVDWSVVASSFVSGVLKMDEAGGAGRNARTMLDAIYPICDLLEGGCREWEEIAEAAGKGAEGTRTMRALAGRSNYVEEEAIMGTPDPGAWAVKGVAEAMRDWK